MNRIFSALHKIHHTGKRTPTLNAEIPKFTVDEQALTDLDSQTIELVLDKLELPDDGDQGVDQVQARRKKRRTENLKGIDEYRRSREHVVTFHEFDTVSAEQYRKLYTEISQARRTHALQTLLITSALAGEGKSTSALNLAITSAAAADQHGVLLIDADFRKPSIHKYLGIYPKWGFADYLRGDVEYSQIFCKTQIPGLTIISAGSRGSNPLALLASTRMEQFVRDIKSQKQYNYIIIDSSPVLLTSEPKSLLRYVDTTIFVVRAKKTPAEVVSQAIKILGKENILGCVLNGITSDDFYFYHYYYSQDYHRKLLNVRNDP